MSYYLLLLNYLIKIVLLRINIVYTYMLNDMIRSSIEQSWHVIICNQNRGEADTGFSHLIAYVNLDTGKDAASMIW